MEKDSKNIRDAQKALSPLEAKIRAANQARRDFLRVSTGRYADQLNQQIHLKQPKLTVGLDLGDRWSHYAILNAQGEFIEEGRVATTVEAIQGKFGKLEPALIAMETGTPARWVSRQVREMGHLSVIAHARELRALTGSSHKSDKEDSRKLARYARADVGILKPVELRSDEAQKDLMVIQARDGLVGARTKLVNMVRSLCKQFGARVKGGSPGRFPKLAQESLPADLYQTLEPVVQAIDKLNEEITGYDKKIEELGKGKYRDSEVLRSVPRVGPICSLAYVLVMDDPARFKQSRDAGCYVGLRPGKDQSGEVDKQMGITKEGNGLMRRLLVQCAQQMLSRRGEDCALRRWGLKIQARGGKRAKKIAVVAVARKLAVLLCVLWSRQHKFVAFPQGQPEKAVA